MQSYLHRLSKAFADNDNFLPFGSVYSIGCSNQRMATADDE